MTEGHRKLYNEVYILMFVIGTVHIVNVIE